VGFIAPPSKSLRFDMPQSLHDLELPPQPLPDYLLWLAIAAGITLLAGVIWYWRKWRHPVARALRQLDRLPDNPPNPAQLATIMRTALEEKSPSIPLLQRGKPDRACLLVPPFAKGGLGGISLPFFQRLDHARFAPTPCSAETFAALKREARTLLEQAR
jgi:hypothetical protein